MNTTKNPNVRSYGPELVANSVTELLAMTGRVGSFCRCYDVKLPSFGTLFYWHQNGYWKVVEGEYLGLQEPPPGQNFVASYTAPNTNSYGILAYTIPAGIMRAGQCLYFQSFLECGPSPSPTTYICAQLGGAATGGVDQVPTSGVNYSTYPVSVPCHWYLDRSDLVDGIPNQAVWRIRGVSRAPSTTDFSSPVPVRTFIASPNTGVTYKVLRTYLKVGS